MSDTPRTDAFAKFVHEGECLPTCDSYAHDEKCPVCCGDRLLADFARELERELAGARGEWKDAPDAPGFWWWSKDGDETELMRVRHSGDGGVFRVSSFEPGFTYSFSGGNDLGGLWLQVVSPETPKP